MTGDRPETLIERLRDAPGHLMLSGLVAEAADEIASLVAEIAQNATNIHDLEQRNADLIAERNRLVEEWATEGVTAALDLDAENEGLRVDLARKDAEIARWRTDYERKNTIAARGVWDSAHVANAISLLREQQRTAAELIPGEIVLIEVSRVLNALGEKVAP